MSRSCMLHVKHWGGGLGKVGQPICTNLQIRDAGKVAVLTLKAGRSRELVTRPKNTLCTSSVVGHKASPVGGKHVYSQAFTDFG